MFITSDNLLDPNFQSGAPSWTPPPQSRDTQSLQDGLIATYKSPAFNHVVSGNRFIEAVLDDYVELYCTVLCKTRSCELIRRPQESKIEQVSSQWRFRFDVPGLYVVRATLEKTWNREICIAVFPDEVNKWLGYPDPRQAHQRRMRLRQIVGDPRVTRDTVVDALERDDPAFGMTGRIVGVAPLAKGSSASGDETFNPRQYNS